VLQRELQALDDSSFKLADFKGKVIVVNIWASWCGPCRSEVPEYEKVRKAFAGQAVEFIGLTTEDPRTAGQRVKQFARDHHFGFRLGWADQDTAGVLMNGRNAIPQTLVVGKDGRVISHWTGYSSSMGGSHLREVVKQALKEADTANFSRSALLTGEGAHALK
jgi:thiol-disulfide isomerase/thioredoxin